MSATISSPGNENPGYLDNYHASSMRGIDLAPQPISFDRDMTTGSRSIPDLSIWKLFVLSLLWIPFNRWKTKQDLSKSKKHRDNES